MFYFLLNELQIAIEYIYMIDQNDKKMNTNIIHCVHIASRSTYMLSIFVFLEQ